MMSQQPDKFFRDKLHNYQSPVSGNAWNRISQNVSSKNRWRGAMKIAASLLLIAAATSILYPVLKNPDEPLSDNISASQSTTRVVPPDTKIQPRDEVATITRPQPTANHSAKSPTGETSKKARDAKKSREIPSVDPEPAPEHLAMEEANVLKDRLENEDRKEKQQEKEIATPEKAQSITIVFTAEEVNRKYLTKNIESQATPDNEETSGLKKILDKANDLKHNQYLLGNLRQKKNEILAMNFRNEKETTRND